MHVFWAAASTTVAVVPPGACDVPWYITLGASTSPSTGPVAHIMAELPSAGQLASSRLPRTLMTPSSPTLAEINSTSGPDGFTPDEERCGKRKEMIGGVPVICKCDGNCHRIFQWSENPVHAETRWVQRSRTFLHSSQKLLANNILLITMVRTWRPAWYRRLGRSESHVPTSGIIPPHSLVTGLICRAGSLQEDPHRCHCRCRPHRDAGRLPRGLLRRIRLL